MDASKDYQNYILELMFENEMENLKRKGIWWLFMGILFMIVGMLYIVLIGGASYGASIYILIYFVPAILIGIIALVIGILTLISFFSLKRRYQNLQMWRYN